MRILVYMGNHKSFDELREMLSSAADKVVIGKVYVHFKDSKSRYIVNDLIVSESDDSILVIYHSSIDDKVKFARPLDSWVEVIDGVRRFSEV